MNVIRHVNVATMTPPSGYGEIPDGAVVMEDGVIQWVGPDSALPSELNAIESHDGSGRWLTPGLIDCHTHLVWAGNRANEFEMRLEGKSYEEIARAGGGILSTVRATRAAPEEELFKSAAHRLEALMAEGVTTCEIKSGYGLELEAELKCLRVIRGLGQRMPCRVLATFLGAHCVPPEFAGQPDQYLDTECCTIMDAMRRGLLLAEAVDAFCEGIAFSPEQTRRILQKAREYGYRIKLHADQLSDSGGAGLIAELGGLSADHCEYTSEESVRKMAEHGTVAVLLPGAFYMLRETRKPPIDLFRRYGVPIAVATDCNPGTSPFTSLLLMMNMACVLFGLTPAEALAGVTRNAARALGLDTVGRIEVGSRADLALFDIDHPRDLSASFGGNRCIASWFGGVRRDTPGE